MNIKQIHMMVCRVWFHENVNVQCTDNMIKNWKRQPKHKYIYSRYTAVTDSSVSILQII